MKAEMLEDYDKASKILDTVLDEDDSNSQAKKRKIAMLKVFLWLLSNTKSISYLKICWNNDKWNLTGHEYFAFLNGSCLTIVVIGLEPDLLYFR